MNVDRNEIAELVEIYGSILFRELDAKGKLEQQRITILSEAVIDGKNAEAHKLQTEVALRAEPKYCSALLAAQDAETSRKIHEAEISLTKAWLYSQSGH
jgi:hypothetical protein